MASELNIFVQTYSAAADLSAKQYYLVKFTASKTVNVCSAATDVPCGVLQNAPGSGGSAVVMHVGKSKVSSDAALSIAQLIGPAADGQADAKTPGTDTTEYVVGQVVQTSSAAAALATVLLNACNPHRAA